MTDRAQDTEAIRAALETLHAAVRWVGGRAIMVPGAVKHSRDGAGALLALHTSTDRLVARLEAAERERDEALAGWDGWQERCFAAEEELVAALAEPGFAGGGVVEPAAATSPGSASAAPGETTEPE